MRWPPGFEDILSGTAAGTIRLESRDTHARVLASLVDVAVRAPDGRFLFTVGKLEVRQGDRLVLLGRNGVGKSQLVHLLRRAFEQDVAGVRVSPSLVLGFLDQGMSHLPGSDTAHGFIAGRFRLGDGRSRSLLAGAGFAMGAQNRPIAGLSPGEKARLGLLALRLTEPSFFLLDEPTNHLDIAGQEALEAEILAQGAAGVLVSHDRSFVQAVGTRFLLVRRGRLEEIGAPDEFYRSLVGGDA